MNKKLKSILAIMLVSLILVGCKSKPNEVTMFCSECLNESTVSKYCPECGAEAKWLTDKPKDDIKKDEQKVEEDIKDEVSVDESKEEINTEQTDKEYKICYICKNKDEVIKLKELRGYGVVHESCYNNLEICSCGNLLLDNDLNNNGKCDICDSKCSECGNAGNSTNSGGLCDTCSWNNAYRDKVACDSCSAIGSQDEVGQTCFECNEGIYRALVQ